ncbi:MAG: hypothetical protein K2I74_04235 [Treponemataceae bacterium]|nr:hypothetical protein [Treponemataceae bacterium]
MLYYPLAVRGILLAASAAPECRIPAHGAPHSCPSATKHHEQMTDTHLYRCAYKPCTGVPPYYCK